MIGARPGTRSRCRSTRAIPWLRTTAPAKASRSWVRWISTNKDTLIWTQCSAFGQPTSRPYVRISKDAGRNWSRSYRLPLDGLPGVSSNSSQMVRSDGRSMLLLTMITQDGWSRRPMVFLSTADQSTWHFLSFITPKEDPVRRRRWRLGETGLFLRLRWPSLVLSTRRAAAQRAHPVHAALPAQSAGRHVERDVLQRRRRRHLAIPFAHQ